MQSEIIDYKDNKTVMQRNTRQRRAILDALVVADHPLSPQEILSRANRYNKPVNIATVYRTLSALVELGTLEEVELPGDVTRYEFSGKGHHHHFRCRKCDRVLIIEKCAADVASMVPPGYIVEEHALFIYGLCADCASELQRK